MPLFRRTSEELARKTTRRGLFSRGADVAFGLLAGAAAGSVIRSDGASAGANSLCSFPGPPCPCMGCMSSGACAKPCVINTTWYAAGCWVSGGGVITCCDCSCNGFEGIFTCGCGTDRHNNPTYCPNGVADS